MAHNIAKIEGRDTFAYTGERPWHGLGTKVPGLMTVEEGIRAGGLDWDVVKVPVMLDDRTGGEFSLPSGTQVPGKFATCRSEGPDGRLIPLGIVGDRYEVVQNRDAFRFFDAALGEGAAALETVGALGRGERVFAIARLPGDIEVTPGDPVERYVLLHTSHDGSAPVEAMFTSVRVVCNNTLNVAVGGAKQTVRVRHTRNAQDALREAHRVLCESDTYWAKVKAHFAKMNETDMTRAEVMSFIEALFPSKAKPEEPVPTRTQNTRDAVVALFDGGMRGFNALPEDKRQTRWAMFQAVTDFADHERSIHEGTNRWEGSVFGSGADLRQRAFDLLTA